MGSPHIEMYQRSHAPEISGFVAQIYSQVPHFDVGPVDALLAEIEAEDRDLACSSIIAVARSEDKGVLSTARLIERSGRADPLPVERVFGVAAEITQAAPGRVFELARLASASDAERGLAWRLAGALYDHLSLDPVRDTVLAAIDEALLLVLAERGWPLEPLGPALFYLGSRTVPVSIDLVRGQQLLRSERLSTGRSSGS